MICIARLCFDWLQLLSKTLVAIADDKWACQLATEATRYLSTYNNFMEEKVGNKPQPHSSLFCSVTLGV